MKKKFATFIFVFCSTANAGLFGPSNFEECILDQMKGIKSDTAANAVTYACRAKFPPKEVPKVEQKRDGLPRIDIWDKPYNPTIFNTINIIKGVDGQYSFELTVTNQSKLDLTGIFIGIPKKSNGKCEQEQSSYREIYSCEGTLNRSTTNTMYCSKFKGSYCIVGIKGTYQSDLDKYFRDLGY
jgi:hypothetical protein